MAHPKDPSQINIEKNNLQLKFSLKGTIAAIIRTALDVGSGKLGGGTLPEWAKAISFESSKERQAYSLIADSLIGAVREQLQFEVSQGHVDRKTGLVYYANQAISFEVFKGLEDNQYALKVPDFHHPRGLKLLEDFMPFYKDWMKANFGMSNEKAEHLAADFRDYFALVFVQLLGTSNFSKLYAWIESPNLAQQIREYEHTLYRTDLKNKYHRASMGLEEVALSDIYIDPGFMVYDSILSPDQERPVMERSAVMANHFKDTKYKHSIHDYFRHHFLAENKSEAIQSPAEQSRLLILLGQPGHGKSSFCYRTAHDLLNSSDFGGNVFFIPLRRVSRDVLNNPLDEFHAVLEDEIDFRAMMKQNKTAPNVLLLDGLDEWRMAERISDAEAVAFLQKCKTLIDRNKNLFIVVTSRFNYLATNKLYDRDVLLFSLSTMDLAQQWQFVRNFYDKTKPKKKRIRKKDLKKINEEIDYIKELIQLPILLQFILMADVDVMAANSRGDIYKNLFDNVLKRKWDTAQQLEFFKKSFGAKELRQYLSFLAFKIFQHKEDFLTRYEVEGFNETEKLVNEHFKNNTVADGLKEALKYVLTSFYLTEKRKPGGYSPTDLDRENQFAIEFMHKSLYEYLACEYLWKAMKKFYLKKNKARFQNFKKTIAQLRKWLATTRFTSETAEYMREIIQADTSCHIVLQEAMSTHLVQLVDNSFLDKYEMPKDREKLHYTADQQVINVFSGFWLIYGELNLHLINEDDFFGEDNWPAFWERHVSKIDQEEVLEAFDEQLWEGGIKAEVFLNVIRSMKLQRAEKANFRNWFLQQPAGERNSFFERWLRSWCFRRQGSQFKKTIDWKKKDNARSFSRILKIIGTEELGFGLRFSFQDLTSQNLQNWIGRRFDLQGGVFRSAVLDFVNFSFVRIGFGTINWVNLIFDLNRVTNLSFANFNSASLTFSNFSFVNVRFADFMFANLSSANLSSADLRYTNLRYTNLSSTNLNSANLSSADLRYTNLSFADLSYAKVDSLTWLEDLESKNVKGLEGLQEKYVVVRKIKKDKETGEETESFIVIPKEEVDEEE